MARKVYKTQLRPNCSHVINTKCILEMLVLVAKSVVLAVAERMVGAVAVRVPAVSQLAAV